MKNGKTEAEDSMDQQQNMTVFILPRSMSLSKDYNDCYRYCWIVATAASTSPSVVGLDSAAFLNDILQLIKLEQPMISAWLAFSVNIITVISTLAPGVDEFGFRRSLVWTHGHATTNFTTHRTSGHVYDITLPSLVIFWKGVCGRGVVVVWVMVVLPLPLLLPFWMMARWMCGVPDATFLHVHTPAECDFLQKYFNSMHSRMHHTEFENVTQPSRES